MILKYLESDRVRLHKFTERYMTAEYFGWLNDHEITRYLCVGRVPVAKADVFAPTGDKDLMFSIIHKDNGIEKYVGTCSLHKIDWIARRGECGYMIGDRACWGKGLATEVVGLVTDYAFNRLGLNKVTAGVVGGNEGSCRVLEKNGYDLSKIIRLFTQEQGERTYFHPREQLAIILPEYRRELSRFAFKFC